MAGLAKLDDLTAILLEITGDDYTKVQIKSSDGCPVNNCVQRAVVSIETGGMIKVELEYTNEVDSKIEPKTLTYTTDGAFFRLRALRGLGNPIQRASRYSYSLRTSTHRVSTNGVCENCL